MRTDAKAHRQAMAELLAGKSTVDEIAKRLGADAETVVAWRRTAEADRTRRIHQLADAARNAKSYDVVHVGGRDAVRIAGDEGTRMSFLTPEELTAFRAALTAAAPTLRIDGLPECTWDMATGLATGRDEASGIALSIVGSPSDATPETCDALGRLYRAVVTRRVELVSEAAKSMTALYNETWRKGRRLSSDEIAERMTIETLSVHLGPDSGGEGTVYLADGDLFAGHAVVDVDANGVSKRAPTLAG